MTQNLSRNVIPGIESGKNIFSRKMLIIIGGAVLVLALLVVAILFFWNPNPGTVVNAPEIPTSEPAPAQNWSAPAVTLEPRGPQSLAGLNLTIYLLSLGMVAMALFSLLESSARGDKVLLDFFSTWVLIAILITGEVYGLTPWFYGFLGASLLGMVISTIWNPSEENEPQWWNQFDTTHWYVAGVVLIIIYLMRSSTVPYPTYIPILVPIVVAILGAGKEIFRQVKYSLIAIAVAIIPAVLQTPTWLVAGLAIEIVLAAVAHHQGYVTTRGTSHDLAIGGRKITIVLDWDLVLFYITVVTLLGYALYGNYAILTIVR